MASSNSTACLAAFCLSYFLNLGCFPYFFVVVPVAVAISLEVGLVLNICCDLPQSEPIIIMISHIMINQLYHIVSITDNRPKKL
jgi:hypothetical protein